jgi:MFS-type transporter involved in bile tolerance (Atg22 family)
MIPAEQRGTAYGVFNSVYGVAWFAGSAAMGLLYDVSISFLIAFSVLTQLLAVPILCVVRRELRSAPLARPQGRAGEMSPSREDGDRADLG